MKDEIDGLLRRLTSPSYGWGPAATFVQFAAMAELLGREHISLHGKTCVDFGCGGIRPLSMAALMYLFGAEATLSIDIAPPGEESHLAVGLYSLILAVLSKRLPIDPGKISTTPRQIRERCAGFDLGALLAGDLRGAPQSLRLHTGDYRKLPQYDRRFDFLTSYSTLQHVADLPEYLGAFRASVETGGAVYAAIDYRDGRSYVAKASPWQYLLDDDESSFLYTNRIRHDQMLKLMKSAGFAIGQHRVVKEQPPEQIVRNILPKYQDISSDDLMTIEAHLLLTPA